MAMTTLARMTALTLIRTDHRRILELFRDFEDADAASKRRIAARALEEISAHSAMEEKLFYPAVLAEVRNSRDIVLEGKQAHHVADMLVSELEGLRFGALYVAKFRQLAASVTAHIEDEEEFLLPAVEKARVDVATLGRAMERFKASYFEGGAARAAAAAGAGAGTVVLLGLGALAAWALYAFAGETEA